MTVYILVELWGYNEADGTAEAILGAYADPQVAQEALEQAAQGSSPANYAIVVKEVIGG